MYINYPAVISDTTITLHKYGNHVLNCILVSLISSAWLLHPSTPSAGETIRGVNITQPPKYCVTLTDEGTLIKVVI